MVLFLLGLWAMVAPVGNSPGFLLYLRTPNPVRGNRYAANPAAVSLHSGLISPFCVIDVAP